MIKFEISTENHLLLEEMLREKFNDIKSEKKSLDRAMSHIEIEKRKNNSPRVAAALREDFKEIEHKIDNCLEREEGIRSLAKNLGFQWWDW